MTKNTKLSSNNDSNRDKVLDGVKGFLILCIILEHNTLLTQYYDWIRPFSDAFAAGCFLIFTFIWPIKKTSFSFFLNKHFSYYIPFILFASITTAANIALYSKNFTVESIELYLKALLLASPFDLKNSTGFMYLWFLPCLCILYFIRLLHTKIGDWFLLLPLASFFLLGMLPDTILIQTPFSLHVIGFIYIIGYLYSKIHTGIIHAHIKIKILIVLSFLSLIASTPYVGWQLFLAGGILPSWQQPALLLFYGSIMLLAIPGSYFLLSLMPKMLVNIFAVLGQESLKLYLLHPIVFILITKLVPIVEDPVLSLVLTLTLSLLISFVIDRLKPIDSLFFPKYFNQLTKRDII